MWMIFSDFHASTQTRTQQNPKSQLIEIIQLIMTSLQNKNKETCFCKVPGHTGIRGNEAADRTTNEPQNIPGLYTTKIPPRDYYYPIWKFIMKKW